MSKVRKTLSLQRAYFPEGFNGNLEEILKEIFKRKTKMVDRVVSTDLLSSMIFSSLSEPSAGDGIYIRAYRFENGSIGLIKIEDDDQNRDLEEFSHPENKKFIKDQLVLYVSGNDVVACDIKKPTSVSKALCSMIVDCGISDNAFLLRIEDVPDSRELDKIKKQGVRSVKFNISSFMANLEPSMGRECGKGSVLRSIFSAPGSNDDIRKRANAIGSISLSRGRFKADEIKRDEWLTQIGNDIAEDEDIESFTIELENGLKISNEKLKINKSVTLPRSANTYSYTDASRALRSYYDDLCRDGVLNG